MQTRNLMWLGAGKRAIEGSGGLGEIGASGHIWQQEGDSKFVTFFGPWPPRHQKVAKKVPFRRLNRGRKANKVRQEMKRWGVRGVRGNLLHVS